MDRRSFIGATASAAVGAVAVAKNWNQAGESSVTAELSSNLNQRGVATPPQEHAAFIGLNFLPNVDAAAIGRLLRLWSTDAQLLMNGKPAMGDSEATLVDATTNLTITFGLAHSAFVRAGHAAKWPFALTAIPEFSTDQLSEKWAQTDLLIQVCADDALRVHHASRELILGAAPFAKVAWQQHGFLPKAELQAKTTPRNLMGQKDGTANFAVDSPEFAQTVWAITPNWFVGGTSLVLRRISMNLDKWETLSPDLKSKSIGREIASGAPLGATEEFDVADMEQRDHHGLVIPADAHMRRARIEGTYLHRRGYNYLVEGDQGLLFAAFAKDPQNFVEIQERLSALDSLNTWTTAIGSGLYAILPNSDGEFALETLLLD